jgi:hypothetical protein
MGDKPASKKPRNWREGDMSSEAQVKRTKEGRRKRLFWTTLLLLALVGATVAIALLVRPAPDIHFVPLSISIHSTKEGYGSYGGHNPLANKDTEALARLPWASNPDLFASAPPVENAWSAAYNRTWFQQWMDTLQKKTNTNPMVIYLNAYARVVDGQVYILTYDSTMEKPAEGGYALKEFLTQLREVGKDNKVKKLVILDLMRPLYDGRRGAFSLDVAAQARQTVLSVEDENRAVLLSCSKGQVSNMADELGHSVFAYYVEQGLGGHADGWDPNDPNNSEKDWITVRELAHFVTCRVARWAERSRGVVQTPELLAPEGFNFVVTKTIHKAPVVAADPTSAEMITHWQQGLRVIATEPHRSNAFYPAGWWRLYDEWRQAEVQESAPEAMAYLQVHLLALEQRWRDGEPIENLEKDWLNDKRTAQGLRDKSPVAHLHTAANRAKMLSLAMLLRDELEESATSSQELAARKEQIKEWKRKLTAVQPLFERQLEKTLPTKANEAEKTNLAEKAQTFAKEAFGKLYQKVEGKNDLYPDFTLALWEAILEELQPTPARLWLYQMFWDLLQEKDEIPSGVKIGEYVEPAFLKRALRLPGGEQEATWQTLSLGFDLLRKSEELLASDSGSLAWLYKPLQEGVRQRQQAEVLLFSPQYVPLTKAREKYETALTTFNRLKDWNETLDKARKQTNESLAWLPYYANYLTALPSKDRGIQYRSFSQAIQTTSKLSQLLRVPEKPPEEAFLTERVREIKAESDKLAELWKGLRLENRKGTGRPEPGLTNYLNGCKDEKTAISYLRVTALLELPFYSVEDRKAIWSCRQEIMDSLRIQTLGEDAATASKTAPTPTDDSEAIQRTLFAARVHLELLQLCPKPDNFRLANDQGGQRLNDVEAALQEKEPDWTKIGNKLREAGAAVAQQWTAAKTEMEKQNDDPYAADWLVRFVYQGKDAYSEIPPLSTRLRKEQQAQVRNCLAQIYQYLSLECENWRSEGRDGEEVARLSKAYKDEVILLDAQNAPVSRVQWTERPRPIPLERGMNEQPLRFNATDQANRNRKPDSVDLLLDEKKLEGRIEDDKLRIGLRSPALGTPPSGFIVQVIMDGWPYHFRWPLEVREAALPHPELRFGYRPKDPDKLVGINVRAIPEQPFYVFVTNPTSLKKTVRVKVRQGEEEPFCVSNDEELPPNQTTGVRIRFKKPERAKTLQWDSAQRQTKQLLFEVYEVENNREKGQPVAQEPLTPKLVSLPGLIPEARFLAGKEGNPNRLELTFKPPPGGLTHSCDLKMELPAELNPGLENRSGRAFTKAATLEKGSTEPVKLTLDDLPLSGTGDPLRVHVQIDGYPRALIFIVDTSKTQDFTGRLLSEREKQVRILGGRGDKVYVAGGQEYKAAMEADSVKENEGIEAIWDDKEDGLTGQRQFLSGGRRTLITLAVSDEGNLLFAGEAKDHTLSRTLARGKNYLLLRVLDQNDRPTDAPVRRVEILVDDTPPIMPKEEIKYHLANKNSTDLELRIKATDPESDIREVLIYQGAFTPDGKPPGDPIARAVRESGSADIWLIRIPAAGDDRLVLTVRAFNNAGSPTPPAQISVDLGALRKGFGTEPGHIKVAVKLNNGLIADGAEVVVNQLDEMNRPLRQVEQQKADGAGKCEFKLPAGRYEFRVARYVAGGRAEGGFTVATVKSGENDPLTLTLVPLR